MSVIPFVLPRRPTTLRLHQVLSDQLAAVATTTPGFKWRIGLSAGPQVEEPPGSGTWKTLAPPYFSLDPLWAVPWHDDEGYGSRRHEDVQWVYQVNCLAVRGDQLEWMRDKVSAIVLGKNDAGDFLHDLDTDDVRITERELADDNGLGESATSGVLPSSLRFRLFATRHSDT